MSSSAGAAQGRTFERPSPWRFYFILLLFFFYSQRSVSHDDGQRLMTFNAQWKFALKTNPFSWRSWRICTWNKEVKRLLRFLKIKCFVLFWCFNTYVLRGKTEIGSWGTFGAFTVPLLQCWFDWFLIWKFQYSVIIRGLGNETVLQNALDATVSA